jgi:cyclophilin family peptidyl-prolyl cis-trans isomerase
MLQTGDPLGDGTGGESIWGGEFEDEFVPGLRHDRPFTLSMANGAFCSTLSLTITMFRLTRFFNSWPKHQWISIFHYDSPLSVAR